MLCGVPADDKPPVVPPSSFSFKSRTMRRAKCAKDLHKPPSSSENEECFEKNTTMFNVERARIWNSEALGKARRLFRGKVELNAAKRSRHSEVEQ